MMIAQMAKSTALVTHKDMFAEGLYSYLHWTDWNQDCCFSAIKRDFFQLGLDRKLEKFTNTNIF